MNNTYTNLNTITLYKTPMFNITDTVMFESKVQRDSYFDSISDTAKLEITDFHDLYEGCGIRLPYNYLDLKKYNTMKLYYNDSLGHTQTYYCNVDNYLYAGTNTCVPLYRIDYFLTFGYLLYNKQVSFQTSRRTISEANINHKMKADDVTIPKIKYTKVCTNLGEKYLENNPGSGNEYIIFLNRSSVVPTAKKGIKVTMKYYLGKDSSNNDVDNIMDTVTIGCIVAIADETGLKYILEHESTDYIEKIVEVLPESSEYAYPGVPASPGYMYLSSDITVYPHVEQFKFNLAYDYSPNYEIPQNPVNIYPSHDKKVLNWLNARGVVVQGFEYDPKDFEDDDLPTNSNVATYDPRYTSGLYFYTFLGYTYCYPVGYRSQPADISYAQKWQSGKNFNYVSNYENTLAYKELQEYNAQQQKYAIENASLATYYQNQLLANQNAQIDISKQQSLISYKNQINSLNNQVKQVEYQLQGVELAEKNKKLTGTLDIMSSALTGNLFGGANSAISLALNKTTMQLSKNTLQSTRDLLNYQTEHTMQEMVNQSQLYDLQKSYNSINTRFQCDTIALSRDNTLANIAISNKYNNSKPGTWNQTDFTEITNYYYRESIDDEKGTDYSQIFNIRNHYDLYGMYIGYNETLTLGNYEGLMYDYIEGVLLNDKVSTIWNLITGDMTPEIFTQLSARFTNGLRLWKPGILLGTNYNPLFDFTTDNTMINVNGQIANSALPEQYKYPLERRFWIELLNNENAYTYYLHDIEPGPRNSIGTAISNAISYCLTNNIIPNEASYGGWCNEYLQYYRRYIPYGSIPTGDRATILASEATVLKNSTYTLDEQVEIIASMNWLCIEEQLYMSGIVHS